MIHHDLTHWPLAITVARGPMTRDDHAALRAEWTLWLDRGERFAILMVLSDGDALTPDLATAREAAIWRHAEAPRIQRQLLATARVVPPEHFEHARRTFESTLPSVPHDTFVHVPSALAFLDWFIGPLDEPCWNQAAVSASIAAALARESGGHDTATTGSRLAPPATTALLHPDDHRDRLPSSAHQARGDST
jgi:hypothetical protein